MRELGDLGDALVVPLLLEGRVGARRRDRVVVLAVDDEQRPPVGIGGVDLGLGPGVEVGVAIWISATPGAATW
jgi:hypothetical protein